MINVIRILLTFIFFSVACGVSASDTCEDFNTHKFFQNIDYDRLDHCASINDGALNLKKDKDGSIPIFKALSYDFDPFYLGVFSRSLDAERLSEMFAITDIQGRNLLHVAIDKSKNIEHLVAILSWGLDPNQALVGSSLTVIDKLAKDNDSNSTFLLSALKIGGGRISKDLKLEYSDNLAILQSERWEEVSFKTFKRKLKRKSELKYDEELCLGLTFPEKVKELLSELMIACVDYPYAEYFDEKGSSYLHILAKEAGDPAVLDLFLGNLDEELRLSLLNSSDKDGLKPIHVAAKYNKNPSILIRLVAWGADPNTTVDRKVKWNEVKTRFFKQRPIHFIAERHDGMSYLMMLTLLALGADPKGQTVNGNTPLHILLSSEITYPPTLSVLLYAQTAQEGWIASQFNSFIKEPKNVKGATPLLYAVSKKLGDKSDAYAEKSMRHYSIISKLLKFGANPDETDEKGWSPVLMYAVQGTDADTFILLLSYSEKSCKMNTKDGFTVLAALKENDHLASQPVKDGIFDTSVLGLFLKKCAA